ncbi:MAG TPA: hypothetical protein VLL25_01545 [Acidimicrobiales bacterium]|nr:hypothetical protein [Acidimicrobiales bacterium]
MAAVRTVNVCDPPVPGSNETVSVTDVYYQHFAEDVLWGNPFGRGDLVARRRAEHADPPRAAGRLELRRAARGGRAVDSRGAVPDYSA